jgi:predicted HAD superfamily Cof-like phosphohydrolase
MKTMVSDIYDMHEKFGVHAWVDQQIKKYVIDDENRDHNLLHTYLKFRIDFLQEELTEMKTAFAEENTTEIVDALIDLMVVALGTLDAFNINTEKAWNEVHVANMRKEPGVKPSRPNPLGLPDLIKKPDWIGPDHNYNVGFLPYCFIKLDK